MNLANIIWRRVDHSLWDKVEQNLRSRLYLSLHVNLDNFLGHNFADKLFADFNEDKAPLYPPHRVNQD